MAITAQQQAALYHMRKHNRERAAIPQAPLTTPDPGPSTPDPGPSTPDPGPSTPPVYNPPS